MTRTILLAAAVALCAGAARAADYDVTPIGQGADFKGCIATGGDNTLGVLAAGSTVTLIAKPGGLKVAKGDQLAGSWTVDEGPAVPVSTTADGADEVSLPVPNTAEAVAGLTTGRTLHLSVNGGQFALPLGDMAQAFTALTSCMAANQG